MGRSSSGWLFDSGALIGLAALFHLPYAFMLVVLSASNAVMRSFQWRDHVVPLIGLLTTLFLCRGTLFVLGSDTWRPLGTLSVHNHPDPAVPELGWLLMVEHDPVITVSRRPTAASRGWCRRRSSSSRPSCPA